MIDRGGGALQKLRGGVWPVLDEASERQRRERIAARVLELQRDLSLRGARRRFAGVVALAALVAALGAAAPFLRFVPRAALSVVSDSVVDGVHLVAGHASLRQGNALAPLARGELELGWESVLVTPEGDGAELRLASAAALTVGPASEVGIVRRQPTPDGFEERVRLRSGRVALRVPKLGTHGKVSVETSDALVEVHGTQFSVRVVERTPLAPFTEVDVREGLVLVRSGAQRRYLGAGAHWSSDQSHPTASDARAEAEASAPARQRAHRARTAERTPAASNLAAQNQLLADAKLAQKNGMPALALRRLETLIARYPDCELAHNARVERFRLLRLLERDAEALTAARAYLDHHPQGFARDEAEQLISTLSEPIP